MGNETEIAVTIKKKVGERLFNFPPASLNDETKHLELEQYKLLIDSTNKMEERRNGSNNIFIAVNSIFATVLTQIAPYPEVKWEKLVVLSLLLPIGIAVSWSWLRTIDTYKRLNYIAYSIIKAFEK